MEPEMLDYLRHIRPRIASTTYHRKEWQIGSLFRWLGANGKTVAGAKQCDIEEYLRSFKCSQQYRQAVCGVVREFYDILKIRHPHECPAQNPATGITFKPDTSTKLFKAPSQAAIAEIFVRLYAHDGDLHIRDRLMAELAYGSGLRRSELARLNIEDIDFENGTLHVTGKGNKPRVVPLTGGAIEAARLYLMQRNARRGPLLVSFFGRRLSLGGVYQIYKERIGLRPHLFRHACATHMLKNGCNVRYIQELLGHERLTTTSIYTTITKENLREVVNRKHPRNLMKI